MAFIIIITATRCSLLPRNPSLPLSLIIFATSITVSLTQGCGAGGGLNQLYSLLLAQQQIIQQQRLAIGGGLGLGGLGLGTPINPGIGGSGGGAPLILVPSVTNGIGGIPGIGGLGGIGGIGTGGILPGTVTIGK